MESTMTHAIDVTDDTFEQVVIEGSKQRPVLVDLWAAWCGPCRTLGPILEKVAAERDGAFTLVKVDVDSNAVGNAVLQAVRSQSIPTVVAFKDGEPVSMFIGAYPEDEVNRFVDSLLPTEVELEASRAEAAAEAGDLETAERGFREVLVDDPANRDAALGLAELLIARDEFDEATPLVTAHLPDPQAESLHARIELAGWAANGSAGPLDSAKRLAAAGSWRDALDAMVASLADDRDDARQAMVTVFAALGDDDELVTEYRRRLAAALF